MIEVVHEIFPVLHEIDLVFHFGLFQRLLRHETVIFIIVSHQYRYGFVVIIHAFTPLCCLTGSWTTNTLPCPGLLLAMMLPPCRSTILWQTARPIPVPSYSLRPCRRCKTPQIRSVYFSSNP